ncbi:MAG: ribosome-associated translation inhibitor RaiA [Clostridia bacterium]|nr:ribosome-associated translation inhibitor RaiA [Clostridia bacterium]
MKLKITGRKIDVTEGLREYTTGKLSKLDKFFGEEATADVTLSVQKDNHIIEVTIHHKGMIYRAEVSEPDMYASIDRVEDVLERQIRKQKTRLEKQLKSGAFAPSTDFGDVEEEAEFKVVKTKTYSAKPMSVEEAILQMNLLGHAFYIFSNAENMDKNVVYKRKDGNYGLIELE